mgnify:CR=1 FL=1
MGRPGGVLEVIDAMWQMDCDMRSWVNGVCAAAVRASGDGAGTIGYFVDTDQDTALEHKMWGGDEHFLAVPRAKHELVPVRDMLRAVSELGEAGGEELRSGSRLRWLGARLAPHQR